MAEIKLSQEDAAAPWAELLRAEALESLEKAESRLGLTLHHSPTVESIGPETAFYDALGRRPHNLMAVAISSENRVVINRVPFLAATSQQRRETLVHEFSHLLVGRRVPGGAPRWLDEGLAMIVSRDHSWGAHTRLMTAASFDNLAPLEELFRNPGRQELDYAQALSATRFLIEHEGGDPDDPKPLIRELTDDVQGQHLRSLIRDPNFIRAFDKRWRRSITSLGSVIAALTTGTVMWLLVTGLFLVAWWRKRRMAAQVAAGWEEDARYAYGEDEMWMYHEGDPTAFMDEGDDEWYPEED